MKISLIASLTQNHVIGRNNQLPWHLPADLHNFKQKTLGKPIIMGRKTHESIGRILAGRHNIVVSRALVRIDGATVANSLETAIKEAGDVEEVIIIGGAELFKEALPQTQTLYLTWVEADIVGDTYFPHFDQSQWLKVSEEHHLADNKNPYNYCYTVYNRR